jgi:hypothetical protein
VGIECGIEKSWGNLGVNKREFCGGYRTERVGNDALIFERKWGRAQCGVVRGLWERKRKSEKEERVKGKWSFSE